ncbi:MAG: fructosamine kinase family protein [Lachnospiraceae bacterium]|nr:fructosamine kinase family protein [Lachnospiraceae bacterium]
MSPAKYDSLDKVITDHFGNNVLIEGKRGVSGGDINAAYLLTLSDGNKLFLKENSVKNADFFRAETEGLKAIRNTGCIRVPETIANGVYGNTAFLLMEYAGAGARKSAFWEDFANALADMHEADASSYTPGGKYGFTDDNYIGAGCQKNSVRSEWVLFFRDCRLLPQFERAKPYLSPDDCRKMDSLLQNLDKFLPEPEHPSLLHGDLWGGNYITGPDGNAWLIDPAVYVGHAEADIAMTELFGGFSAAFYRAYEERGLIQPGYGGRRDLYNLYHMLNHLNLFGGSYLGAVRRIISSYT